MSTLLTETCAWSENVAYYERCNAYCIDIVIMLLDTYYPLVVVK